MFWLEEQLLNRNYLNTVCIVTIQITISETIQNYSNSCHKKNCLNNTILSFENAIATWKFSKSQIKE